MTIAVTGAAGQLGHIVIDKLKQKVSAANLLALVRRPEQTDVLGVAAQPIDYSSPATLDAPLRGVNTLLLISSSEIGKRAVQHANVIAAAKKAGVERIVYTSVLHADESSLSLADEHRATEAELKASGLAYTLLRNGWYTENYTGSIGPALANGALIGSAGDGRISSAAREDFAEAAVAVLTTPGHENATYELAGDEAWTLTDLAAEISRQTGKDIPYRDLPAADYAAALEGAGLPKELAAAIASYDVSAAQGALYGSERTLSQLIGRPTTTLATSVERALKSL
ncbi:MAG: NAD(P)-dependent oxidoreductase [Sphingobium sp.]|uniref:SDR family oxidoreductase n=1 Tax=Sphingomonas melonis TaxID=152682 RepID=UPI00035C3A2A|nr:SDR family oxidoreductase [Sphingomonas melonis]MBS47079.1 NAD(P)-dependent oxidoreductase [Sphingobium sp.]|tara:strand:- start:5264 stop:6115 length:852 start_codon:yes stop_codon:yes gene_type:complete